MVSVKKQVYFILKQYSKMSGDKKIRLGFSLSETVRAVRKAGKLATGA